MIARKPACRSLGPGANAYIAQRRAETDADRATAFGVLIAIVERECAREFILSLMVNQASPAVWPGRLLEP